MNTHQGQIDAEFYPTQHAVDVVLIGVLVTRTEKAASVVRPPRNACSLNTQACSNLTTKCLPIVTNVAAPQGRAVTLDAWETATSKDHGFTTSLTETFVNGLVDEQGIDISYLFPTPPSVVDTTTYKVIVLRFSSILPPSIDAEREEAFAEVLPIRCCGLWIEEIYPVSARDIILVTLHLTTDIGILVNLRPHAEHQSDTHLMETVGKRLGIRIEFLVELHGIPPVLAPILPVLNDETQRHILLAEAVGRL